jgi:hypothetical protein
MRRAFLQRALKIYVCQVGLLIFLLSGIAVYGIVAQKRRSPT